jgi:4-alpha-glucanotransferase
MKRFPRSSGILLHITSLPSPYGIGDFGPEAQRFADFLKAAGQRLWQILPLNPTDTETGNSPYHTTSAFALSPWLISPELLVRDGFITEEDAPVTVCNGEKTEYREAVSVKKMILARAFERFHGSPQKSGFEAFVNKHSHWLEDFALFQALKEVFDGRMWSEWPVELRDREPAALERARKELAASIEREKFYQYLAFSQWFRLKSLCASRGLEILGDVTIYVNYDSVDVWTNPDIFKLNEDKSPRVVAGVPPDYFSETGQLWGNPLYRWHVLRERNYDWWMKRIAHNLSLYDRIRIDHFRGFVAYWEVKAGEKSAVNGRWIEAPAMDFFQHVKNRFPDAPIIAEDLGVITPDVVEVIRHFGFPGMRLLLFAFGGDLADNPYLPHNIDKNCVVYTGTHDNNTVRGWYEDEITQKEKEHLLRYLGRDVSSGDIPWEMMRLAMMTVADTAVIPMQDILGLGSEARMNRPSKPNGNWEWRLRAGAFTPQLAARLKDITEIYGRLPN